MLAHCLQLFIFAIPVLRVRTPGCMRSWKSRRRKRNSVRETSSSSCRHVAVRVLAGELHKLSPLTSVGVSLCAFSCCRRSRFRQNAGSPAQRHWCRQTRLQVSQPAFGSECPESCQVSGRWLEKRLNCLDVSFFSSPSWVGESPCDKSKL